MYPIEELYEQCARGLFREYILLFNLGIDDERMEKRMKNIEEDLFSTKLCNLRKRFGRRRYGWGDRQ